MPDSLFPFFESIQEYDLKCPHIDIEVFQGAAQEILKKHALPIDSLKLFPDGTNIVFAQGTERVIKLFPPFMRDQFESESPVLRHLQKKLTISTPVLEYEGEIEGWSYLIMSRLEGETLEKVWGNLDFENKLSLIQEIGLLIKQVHSLGVHDLSALQCNWSEFMENQLLHCRDRHSGNEMKKELLSELPSYLRAANQLFPQSIHPVLLTGEYTPFNLLVQQKSNRWELSGMIDFADCMIGFREYDLLGPGAFLIQGDKRLLKAFLSAYGYSEKGLNPHFSHRLTALMLLHRFSNLKIQLRIQNWETQANSLKDLEELVWGL